MRSPTSALLWELWRKNRAALGVVGVLTLAGRIIEASEHASGSVEPSSLVELLQMVTFVLQFGILNYTESNDGRGVGNFPQRLFTLPVSTLRLVAIPVLTGITLVELLYLAWFVPLSSASTSPWFVAVLLGASIVCYQAAFWTLERLGSLRLIVAAGVAFGAFVVGLLPTFAPSPPPPWRSEAALGVMAAGVAGIVFLLEWRSIARKRSGARRMFRIESLRPSTRPALSETRLPFASATSAQFWFEWRCGGGALPVLVAGVLLFVFGPLTWIDRHDAAASLNLLLGTLAVPIVLAIPIGMAFARPMFWSDDMSVPAFVAVRPLTDEDIVAIKIKVAAASVGLSWALVLAFLGLWLSLWGNVDSLSQLAIQWWSFHEQSIIAVYAMAALIVIAGMLLTWRFLVVRLWSGMSGRLLLFAASILSALVAAVAWMVFDGTRLPDWVLADPAHMAVVVWILAIAVVAKFWLAAYSWHRVSLRYARHYLLVWSAAMTSLLTLGLLLWDVLRIYVALDFYRLQSLLILVALLTVPIARMGLAPSLLARNRHR